MFKKILSAFLCIGVMITVAGCSDNQQKSDGLNQPDKKITGNTGEVKLEEGDTYAVISVKDFGDITVKLYPDAAPKGVQNFIDLANSGFYEGKTFHRIMSGFMAQGGAATDEKDLEEFGIETNYEMRHFYGAFCYANAMGRNTSQFYIVNDKSPVDFSMFDLSYLENQITTYKGIADSAEKDSNTYIQAKYYEDYYSNMKSFVEKATDEIKEKYKANGGEPALDGNYTVFGQTVDGFDVLDKISAVEVEENSITQEKSQPVEDVIIEKVEIKTYSA